MKEEGAGTWDISQYVSSYIYQYPHSSDRETEAQRCSHPIHLVRDGARAQTQLFLAPNSIVLCYAMLGCLRLIGRQESHSFIADGIGKGQEPTGSHPPDPLSFLLLHEGAMLSFRNLTRQWKGSSGGFGRPQTMLREHSSAAGDSKFQTLGKRHLMVAQKPEHPCILGLGGCSLSLQS